MKAGILFTLGLFGGIAFAAWKIFAQPNPVKTRLSALEEKREQLLGKQKDPLQLDSNVPEYQHALVNYFQLQKSKHGRRIRMKLATAGWRSQDAVIRYLFFKACLPLIFGALGILYIYVLEFIQLSDMGKMLASMGCVLFGYYGPDLYIKNAAEKRRKALTLALPDTLDLMVICAEAGLSPDATLEKISHEISMAHPQMAEELRLTAVECSVLPNRKEALENFKNRVNFKEITALVNALIQTEKYGTPLAQAMRVLSAEFRNERMMRAEEKAARLPALLTAPMIIFILPPLFIVLVGPGILRMVDSLGSIGG